MDIGTEKPAIEVTPLTQPATAPVETPAPSTPAPVEVPASPERELIPA